MSEWVEVTGRITVEIVLAPKETRLPFDREAFVADLLDRWHHTKDYVLDDDENDITVRCEVQKIEDIPDDQDIEAEVDYSEEYDE